MSERNRDERLQRIENLELNRETVQDLMEGESEAAGGAVVLPPSALVNNTCYCIKTQGCPTQPVETAVCTRDTCGCITYHCG
jgi:hypothetical protein